MGGLLSSLLGGERNPDSIKKEYPANWDEPDLATGLTPRQKRAVVDTWTLVQTDLKATGVAVLIALFEAHPEYQKLFPAFREISISDLGASKRFTAHASSVMHAISSLVETLEDDTEVLVELLKKIGINHSKFRVPPRAFSDLKVELLKILKVKLGKQFTPEAEKAWDQTLTVANSIVCQQLSVDFSTPTQPYQHNKTENVSHTQEEQ